MRVHGLIDSGALVAVLDRQDAWHARCLASLQGLRLPLATTTAALTEAFHLLRAHEAPALWRLLRSGTVALRSIGQDDLPELEALMERYRDRPMDFADATLVLLAQREGLRSVLTVDDDFLVYRPDARHGFDVHPTR